MSTLRKIRLVLWVTVGIATLGAAALLTGIIPSNKPLPMPTGSGVADIGGPFKLTSHKGRTITDAELRGRPFLVFFGFTHCPDVCPTTLAALTARYETLGSSAKELTTILVTVDPERDTQELLALYMEAFDPSFFALRGSVTEIEAMVKTYRAYAQKVPLAGTEYTMDHSGSVYMMDRDGRFVGTLDRHEAEEVQLAKLRRLIGK